MKFKSIIIIALIILAIAWYNNPEKTKETLQQGFKKMVGASENLTKEYMANREENLGMPTVPCENDGDCNENIIKCDGNCTCINGECIKNFGGT